MRLQATVSAGEISNEPKILAQRFVRLCKAFNLESSQLDNAEGKCEVLIGLKAQSIQTTRICEFKLDEFKEVGVYQTPILRKYLFVSEDLEADEQTTTLFTIVDGPPVDLPSFYIFLLPDNFLCEAP